MKRIYSTTVPVLVVTSTRVPRYRSLDPRNTRSSIAEDEGAESQGSCDAIGVRATGWAAGLDSFM